MHLSHVTVTSLHLISLTCLEMSRNAMDYTRAGFTGGLVVDYPNSTKAKKYYLCLSFEHGYKTPAPKVADQPGGAAAARFDVSSLVEKWGGIGALAHEFRGNKHMHMLASIRSKYAHTCVYRSTIIRGSSKYPPHDDFTPL